MPATATTEWRGAATCWHLAAATATAASAEDLLPIVTQNMSPHLPWKQPCPPEHLGSGRRPEKVHYMQLLHSHCTYIIYLRSQPQNRGSMTICRIHVCLENPDPGQTTGPVTVCRTQNEGFWLNQSHHCFKRNFLKNIHRFLVSTVDVHWLIASYWLWKVMGSVLSSNLRFQ